MHSAVTLTAIPSTGTARGRIMKVTGISQMYASSTRSGTGLMIFGERILILEDSRATDGLYSTNARVKSEPSLMDCIKRKDPDAFKREACRIWADVRSFGQVFAFKDPSGSVSIPVRGPVSISEARSLDIVDIISLGITKVTNMDDQKDRQKDSTTMAENTSYPMAFTPHMALSFRSSQN